MQVVYYVRVHYCEIYKHCVVLFWCSVNLWFTCFTVIIDGMYVRTSPQKWRTDLATLKPTTLPQMRYLTTALLSSHMLHCAASWSPFCIETTELQFIKKVHFNITCYCFLLQSIKKRKTINSFPTWNVAIFHSEHRVTYTMNKPVNLKQSNKFWSELSVVIIKWMDTTSNTLNHG